MNFIYQFIINIETLNYCIYNDILMLIILVPIGALMKRIYSCEEETEQLLLLEFF